MHTTSLQDKTRGKGRKKNFTFLKDTPEQRRYLEYIGLDLDLNLDSALYHFSSLHFKYRHDFWVIWSWRSLALGNLYYSILSTYHSPAPFFLYSNFYSLQNLPLFFFLLLLEQHI